MELVLAQQGNEFGLLDGCHHIFCVQVFAQFSCVPARCLGLAHQVFHGIQHASFARR